MGAGIAEVAASHGHQVLLYDISAEALTRAIDGIHARLNSRVTRGKLTAETCERTLKRLIPVTDIHGTGHIAGHCAEAGAGKRQ